MLKIKHIAALAVTGVALTSFGFASQASAFETVAQSYAVVGSDTLEDVVGYLTNNKVTTDQSQTLGNFDATGGATGVGSYIITKPGGTMFQRPNGSGDGRIALMAAIEGYKWVSGLSANLTANSTAAGAADVSQSIDIVRSSSDGTVDPTDANNKMQRFTFGRDAVAYAFGSALIGGSAAKAAYVNNIPATDLKAIYQCDATVLGNYGIKFAWIPQLGSGTRKDFLKMINTTVLSSGASDTTVADDTLAAATESNNSVTAVSNGKCIKVGQEHDAAALGAYDIMPMSATRWIAMKNGMSPPRIATGADLGSPLKSTTTGGVTTTSYDNSGTTRVAPYVTAANGTTLLGNPVYYANTKFGRDTYLFASRAKIVSDSTLAKLFDYTRTSSLTYTGYAPNGTNPSTISANYTLLTASMNAADLYAASSTLGTNLQWKMKFGFLPTSIDPTLPSVYER